MTKAVAWRLCSAGSSEYTYYTEYTVVHTILSSLFPGPSASFVNFRISLPLFLSLDKVLFFVLLFLISLSPALTEGAPNLSPSGLSPHVDKEYENISRL